MAIQRLATYAPYDVTVVLTHPATGTTHVVGGYSADSLVNIEREVDSYSLYTGADNSAARVHNASKSATITVSLHQASATNDFLTACYNYDDARRSSEGLITVHVKDNSGRSDFFSDDAYVAVPPDANFSNELQTRDWVIHAANLQSYNGGNSKLNQSDVETLAALGTTVDARWVD